MDFNDTISISKGGSMVGQIITQENYIVFMAQPTAMFTKADLIEVVNKMQYLEDITLPVTEGR